MPHEHIHFVTGKLAAPALERVLADLAPRVGFDYSIGMLGISVAALMTPEWIARHVRPPEGASRVLLPGYCAGDLSPVEQAVGRPVERGPKDLRQLPEFFGRERAERSNDGAYEIEILAEINHAPRRTRAEIMAEARRLQRDGADLIDLGCDPGTTWPGVAEAVRALRDAGHRVSIDSLNPAEIGPAVRAGAELVLSVNSSNREAAPDWGCPVVAIPDVPDQLATLEATIEFLADRNVAYRLDPILEPIGFGFAASLGRYLEVRRRFPDAEMMMGIGNLTELTDADSAPINVLLLGFCQEVRIRSVLTTQVINWARTSVRECDLARRLVHYAVHERALPKHVEPGLIMLRDERLPCYGRQVLDEMAAAIRDYNVRLFAEESRLHLLVAGQHLEAEDPYLAFEQLERALPRPLSTSHAFYLGYEMAKAVTALTLGKDYRQDEALDWGFLTRPEESHRDRKTAERRQAAAQDDEQDTGMTGDRA